MATYTEVQIIELIENALDGENLEILYKGEGISDCINLKN